MFAIDVSPEMTAYLAPDMRAPLAGPAGATAWLIDLGAIDRPATLTFNADPARVRPIADADALLLLLPTRAACERLLGRPVPIADGAILHLPADLRRIAVAVRDGRPTKAAALPYRLAKCIELLCEILAALGDDALPPALPAALTEADARRLSQARRLIDERWSEKLTLAQIARGCGLNRSKLARGFREVYRCTVAEALAERRLAEASAQLLHSDLPVSQVGYRSGYTSNASFSRAFGRRFGLSPSDYRAGRTQVAR